MQRSRRSWGAALGLLSLGIGVAAAQEVPEEVRQAEQARREALDAATQALGALERFGRASSAPPTPAPRT